MHAQMGNGYGKGNKSGERKKESHAKKNSCPDGDLSSPQGIENADLRQQEEGKRLFSEHQAKRKVLVKDFTKKLNIKPRETVSDVEKCQPKNQTGSSSMSRDHDINEHYSGIIQGDYSHMNHSQDGLRSRTHDGEEPSSTVNELQSHSHLPLSTTHLPGSESNRVSFDTPPGGPPVGNSSMPLNRPDLSGHDAPESIPPSFHSDVLPSGPSHTVNGSFPVCEPEPNASNASERVPEEGHNSVHPGDHDVHDEPGIPPNHALENDASRGPECGSSDVQSAVITTDNMNPPDQTDGRPRVKEPALGDDLRNNSEEKSSKKAIPQEQTEYVPDVTSNQPISLTPQAKIESSTPSGMQIVPGLTENAGVNKEKITKEEARRLTGRSIVELDCTWMSQ